MSRRISEAEAREVERLYVLAAPALHLRARRTQQAIPTPRGELVQEVFHAAVHAWDKLGGLDVEDQRKWPFTVLRNKTVDR